MERGRLKPTEEEIAAAVSFLRTKWAERNVERGDPVGDGDLSGACKFASQFAQRLFGGEMRGNDGHQHLVVEGRVVDLCAGAADVAKISAAGKDPYAHDADFWGNPDHEEAMASCVPRIDRWIAEYLPSRTAAGGAAEEEIPAPPASRR